MHISWLGQTCIKLQTKNSNEETTIIFDPYRPSEGDFPRSLSGDIVLFSNGENNTITISGNPFTISSLGEFDIKNNIITTWPGVDGSIIYKVTSENLQVVHLGKINKKISPESLEGIGKVDVLLIPVGGKPNYLTIEEAVECVSEIEPRIIIPIAYASDNDPKNEPVENFIKKIGLKPEVTDKKIIIKSKDLPTDDAKLMILEKNI